MSGHLARHLYKHLLGWPVTFDDLEHDGEIHKSLKYVQRYDAGLADLCLDFTWTENYFGKVKLVEFLLEAQTLTSPENLPEYVECCLEHCMLGRVRPQLTEFLLGFYDVLPEPLLTVFDFKELELLMCR